MKYVTRLLMTLLALQLLGCAIDRSMTLRCVGECALDVKSSAEAIDPTALPKGQ